LAQAISAPTSIFLRLFEFIIRFRITIPSGQVMATMKRSLSRLVASSILMAMLSAQLVGVTMFESQTAGETDLSAVSLLQVEHSISSLRVAHDKEKSQSSSAMSFWSFITPEFPSQNAPSAGEGWQQWNAQHGKLRNAKWWVILSAFAGHLGLICVVAYVYLKYRTPGIEQQEGSGPSIEGGSRGFEYGLCDNKNCLDVDFMMCLCSWCCLGIRWGDTLSRETIGLVSFWVAVIFWGVCTFLWEDLGFLWALIVFLVAAVFARQRLRKSFGLESATCMTIAEDSFTWLCCCCCATLQEARQVEYMKPVKEMEQ